MLRLRRLRRRGGRAEIPLPVAGRDGVFRCGAYMVEIPGLTLWDIDGFIRLLREQHAHFSARMKKA